MTAAEKYQKGVEMERKGSSGAEIAVALGYASRQEWYDAKYHFKNKALTQRAAAQSEDSPEPAAILEGLSCVKPAAEPMKEEPVMAAPKMLLIQREFSAQGEKLQYRFFGGKVTIKQIGAHDKAIVLSNNDVIIMMMELHELLMEVKENAS